MRSVNCVVIASFVIAIGPAPWVHAAKDTFGDLPPGWQVRNEAATSPDQTAAVGRRLGVRLNGLTNTVLSVEGQRLQVNTMTAASEEDAARLYQKLLTMHWGCSAFVLRDGLRVVEFVGDSVPLARRAHYVLGFKPKAVVYSVRFDAAPLKSSDDMSWNRLFQACLQQEEPGKAPSAELVRLRQRFEFDSQLTLRACGQCATATRFELVPRPQRRDELADGELVRFQWKNLPRRWGIPCVTVAATIRSEAFTVIPSDRSPGHELLAATSVWPVADSEVVALAREITRNASSPRAKVEALLEWLLPGRNVKFGGDVVGSRYGVKQVLKQRYGQCWDFSDLFVTLARAAGVPCRQVAGWWYEQSGHIWAEVWLEGEGWWPVDPTAGGGCGSDYIPYVTSEDGGMPLVYLTAPEIEVLRTGQGADE
jgi:hypothetical protein